MTLADFFDTAVTVAFLVVFIGAIAHVITEIRELDRGGRDE
jgi:hypothetical protein